MVGSVDASTMRVANFYVSTKSALSQSLQRISSGKQFIAPRDNAGYYMRFQKLRMETRGFEEVRRNLQWGQSLMGVAEEGGNEIINTVKRMKELVGIYWDPSSAGSERTLAQLEFEDLKGQIDTIKNTTWFERRQLIQGGANIASVMINPNDVTDTLDIVFDAADIVDSATMDITGGGTDKATAMATVDAQFDRAMNYIAKVSGYRRSLDSQLNISAAAIENNNAFESTVNSVNDPEEMARMVNYDIRQQAALSVMAQSSMSGKGVLMLLGMN